MTRSNSLRKRYIVKKKSLKNWRCKSVRTSSKSHKIEQNRKEVDDGSS